jgi:hypothetical protein
MVILILLSFIAVSITLDWFLNYSSDQNNAKTIHEKKVKLSTKGDFNPGTA